jgi:hypothetical protein
MNIFLENHQQLLKTLLEYDVKFILVGGYAVVYHGYKRTTGDMDLWIEPNNQNKEKLINALRFFDFNSDDLDYISNLDFTKHIAFHFWEEPERVDCITYISNVTFEEADNKKILASIENLTIPIIQYNHLIQSKITSQRLKDRADVEELQKINQIKRNI